MKRVLRAGADELLLVPLDPGDATRALLKISEARWRSDRRDGGRGHLVRQYGRRSRGHEPGRRTWRSRCATSRKARGVIDLDLQTGGLAVLLDLEPEVTIMPLIRRRPKARFDSARIRADQTSSGLYLLAAPKRIEEGELVTDVDRRRRDRPDAAAIRFRDRRLRRSYRRERGRRVGALRASVLCARAIDHVGAMRMAVHRSVRAARADARSSRASCSIAIARSIRSARSRSRHTLGRDRSTRKVPRDENALERDPK